MSLFSSFSILSFFLLFCFLSNRISSITKALPPPELVEPTSPEEAYYYAEDTVPPALDLSFDFLRITWISTIICVLFVQLDLQESLWIGSLVGALYVLMIKLITYCSNCNANAS